MCDEEAKKQQQITFTQKVGGTRTYTIKRLVNLHLSGFWIGAEYAETDFKSIFANSDDFEFIDIILE